MADDGKDAAAEGERSMIGQIIDADGQFTPDMTACMEEWDFNGKGLDYNVCAVFGAQSSGAPTVRAWVVMRGGGPATAIFFHGCVAMAFF